MWGRNFWRTKLNACTSRPRYLQFELADANRGSLTQVKWSSLMEMHSDRLLTATAAMAIYQIHFPFVYTECIKKVLFEVAAIQISRNLLY